MNASQSKQLLSAARKAVCFLEPNTRVWQDLKIALARLEEPKVKDKCCFCEQLIIGESFPGFSKKLRPRVACHQCTHDYIVRRDEFATWCELPRETNFTTKEAMQYCACSHLAGRHTEDKDGNLLKCQDCDCDHFHYQQAAAA